MDWPELLDRYLGHLKLERGLSDNTVSAYRADLAAFCKRSAKIAPEALSVGDVTGFFSELNAKGARPSTLARKVSALRRFCGFLADEGILKENPVGQYSAPKISRYHPDYLTVEEMDQILEATSSDPDNKLRDRAIVEVLYGCGLRLSELRLLKQSQIEFSAGFVRVLGKGNKQRLVPIGTWARRAVEEYLDGDPARKKHSSVDFVFVNRSGKPFSRVWLWKIVKQIVDRTPIRKLVTPHTFRHTFATHLLRGGADLRMVQEMLGHADISTTEIYTKIDRDYIVAEHRKYHPRELAGFRKD